MGLSRQEYWSGLPFPSPGELPDPGMEPRSPASQADHLPTEPGLPPLGNPPHRVVSPPMPRGHLLPPEVTTPTGVQTPSCIRTPRMEGASWPRVLLRAPPVTRGLLPAPVRTCPPESWSPGAGAGGPAGLAADQPCGVVMMPLWGVCGLNPAPFTTPSGRVVSHLSARLRGARERLLEASGVGSPQAVRRRRLGAPSAEGPAQPPVWEPDPTGRT